MAFSAAFEPFFVGEKEQARPSDADRQRKSPGLTCRADKDVEEQEDGLGSADSAPSRFAMQTEREQRRRSVLVIGGDSLSLALRLTRSLAAWRVHCDD